MRWQLIADHNERPNRITIIRRFLFELVGISLDRNYSEVINLLFVLPGLHLNILETDENIATFFGTKNSRRA